ncbi:MAG: DNA polymerase III subunit delta [Nitrospirota bacterium]
MSYRNFLDEIRKGLPSANYLLSSSDPFLITEAVSLIKGRVPAEERDFNLHIFDLLNSNGVPFEQIIDVLNTVPFFSGKKFVIIDNFQKIPKKDFSRLEQYLLNPSGSSVMVLLNAGQVKKPVKDKLKELKHIHLDINEREIPLWLKEKARTKGFRISDRAVDYLLGTIGPDLGMLSSELDKFMLIGRSDVDKEDIIELIEGKRTYNAFALIDAIRAKNTERVFRIYSVLRETEEPYSLLGALNWQFGNFIAGKNSREDMKYLYNVFDVLNKADVDIKSSGSFYPVELLLVKLIRLSKQR